MKWSGVLHDFITDRGQLEFAYFPVEGWIIDPEVHSLLDDSSSAMCLPTNYGKNVHTDAMF